MTATLVDLGRHRTPRDGARRYLPAFVSFDTRALMLSEDISQEWDPAIQEQHRRNQRGIRESLLHRFGVSEAERKIEDFTDLGSAPWSVVALHNTYLDEVREAFTFGAYYPAMLGAVGLGERILNHLILALREDYASAPLTRTVMGKDSFDNWGHAIRVLTSWQVFDQELGTSFRQLMRARNAAVHYRTELDDGDARASALQAIRLLQEIVDALFRPLGSDPHFIAGTVGHCFLTRAAEDIPLIRRFFIPASYLVGPDFEMRPSSSGLGFGHFDVLDDTDQDTEEQWTDEQFAMARKT